MITARDGHAIERFSYGTYGELLKAPITKIRFLYNGSYGVMTDENGLYYMRARYYNPDIKRFINQDIKVGDITNSQSLNRYAYCEGNPVSMVDPFGLCGENANDQGNFWSNFTIHDWLGLAGFGLSFLGVPGMVLGALCDVANAALYFKEGDIVQGAVSLVCAIPGIGDTVGAFKTGTKLAKVTKIVGNGIRSAQKMYVTVSTASNALDLAGDAKIEYAVNGGNLTSSVKAKIAGAAAMAGIAVLSGKSLMKDARSFAKTTEIRFNTKIKETADAVSGKNFRYEGVAACFTAGTQVKTAEGDKNIEDVEEGDYVLAKNPETGEQEYKKVTRTYIHEKTILVHVFVGEQEIETTPEHPFYVEGAGFVCAGELKAGDIVQTADGRKLPVDGIEAEYLNEPVLVYNFEVEDFHTYYVSGLGVLVHNMCMVAGGEYSVGDATFMDSNDAFLKNINKRVDIDANGYFDVIAHGRSDGIEITHNGQKMTVDSRTAARLIQNTEGYNGQAIRLLSCNTGALNNGFAQNLANKLNVAVYAPTNYLWSTPNGNYFVAGMTKTGMPDMNNKGTFKLFKPGGNR